MSNRVLIKGEHTSLVLEILKQDIQSIDSINSILAKAKSIIEKSVDPTSTQSNHQNDGLLYGLIQSGKTSIITVAASLAADNGFDCIVILTSDNNLLYEQTLERVRQVLKGINVIGKNDWKDVSRFNRQIKNTPFAIVCSKNSSILNSLLNQLKISKAKNLSSLIIDDEADQASLNTKMSKSAKTGIAEFSKINNAITKFRSFFKVNTYLQVTATPQALFLQSPNHSYRPTFTVLSEPGLGYVGGDDFFKDDSRLLNKDVKLQEVDQLKATHQPVSSGTIPIGLKKAILTFLIAATSKLIENPTTGYAFLCHVSMNTKDHEHIVRLIDNFKIEASNTLKKSNGPSFNKLITDLNEAYIELNQTDNELQDFSNIIDKLKFFINGTNVKLINATSNDEIQLDAAYNLFVGGNKLGRGVTIKNLLVSYYGRNPKKPSSDTVLQHARMYGYREKDIGVTRLFLPKELAEHFTFIHQMETALREIVSKYPEGKFEGLFISDPLKATRSNVLDPNSIGMFIGGRSYNPKYPLRDSSIQSNAIKIDGILSEYTNESIYYEVPIDKVIDLIELVETDPSFPSEIWDKKILRTSLEKIKTLFSNKAYLVVKRGRDLQTPRRETAGIISGGEESLAPLDSPTLFIYKQNPTKKGEREVWWPQLRFPQGKYALAFSFKL